MASPRKNRDVNVDLAVALFERGFTEERIGQALQECSTLAAALDWLSSNAGETPSSSAGSAQDGSPAGGESLHPRRRVMRKVTPQNLEAPQKIVAPAATAASDTESIQEQERSGIGSAQLASSAEREQDSMSPSASTNPVAGPPVVIEARDASGWWHAASVLWKKSGSLGPVEPSPSADEAEQGPHTEEESAVGAGTSPGRAAEELDQGLGADIAKPEEAVRSATSPRQPQRTEQEEHDIVQRPPAAPCAPRRPSVPARAAAPEREAPAQLAEEASSSGVQPKDASPPRHTTGKRLSSLATPRRASPNAMRVNPQEEVCGICCNDVPGGRAVRLGCSHGWYCGQCVLRHTEARLATGAASVTCPECCTAVAERDLRKLLPAELMERLLSRSLEKAVSSAPDLWACPTPNCPMRVALGEGELPRLKCTMCNKTSCLRCGTQPYHRGMTCAESRARRGAGGKRKRDDDMEGLMKWIQETGTKQCPTCNIAVSKQNLNNQHTQYSECHKMCCRNCNTRFCFKCLAILTDSYTCGCTINAHGFIDPQSGKRLNHLRRGASAKAKAKPKAKVKANAKQKARAR